MIADVDVAVVGAGVAGLACAAALRQAGRSCILLEASSRIGGRAWTTRPSVLNGAAFDHGASWLHAAERNPLVPIARSAGVPLIDFGGTWTRRVMTNGVAASEAELAAYDHAEDHYDRLIREAAAGPVDCSMADAVTAMREDPWLATIETFEATLVEAADARRLSVRDAVANALSGTNLNVAGGLGAFIEEALTQPASLETRVWRIAWDGEGAALDTRRGSVRARACVVTVSTGVLRAGDIAFSPALPQSYAAALDGLPMGALIKVALAATSDDRLGLPAHCSLQARVTRRHTPAMSFITWPEEPPYLVGFVGGSAAEALAHAGGQAIEGFAREQLRAMLGSDADRAIGAAVIADWTSDPWHRGAYAYALPGHAGARAALAEPLAGGRLRFAGEAVATGGLAGTVGGAYTSGHAAALAVLGLL